MSAAATAPFAWRPPSTERYGIGATLALLAHAALVAGLALGLQWRIQSPPVFSAELWAAVPQAAAPAAAPAPAPAPTPTPAPAAPKPTPPAPRRETAPPAPAPLPRVADIAAERARAEQRRAQEAEAARRARQEAAERDQALRAQKAAEAKAREAAEQKARAAAQAKAAEEKRQAELTKAKAAQEEAKLIAKAREANLKRMLAQAGSADATGTAAGSTPAARSAKDAGPSAEFAGRIKARIKPNIKLLTEVPGNPVAEVEVRSAPDGTIIARRIVKPSGNAVWDDTVLRAIDSTRMLPRDTDGRIPALMILVFPRQE